MTETVTNYRRIDRLKALAIEQDLPTKTPNSSASSAKLLLGSAAETYSIPLHL
jgi:hypothetical protein